MCGLKRSARLLLSTTPNPPEGSPSSTHRHFTTRPGAPRVKENVPITSAASGWRRGVQSARKSAPCGPLRVWEFTDLGTGSPPFRTVGRGKDTMDTTTTVVIAITIVLLVLYVLRRRGRVSRDR